MRSPKTYGLRRAQEDYLVDRRDVKAQQCVQLTRTNRPFGLTIKFTRCRNSRQHSAASLQFESVRKRQRFQNPPQNLEEAENQY